MRVETKIARLGIPHNQMVIDATDVSDLNLPEGFLPCYPDRAAPLFVQSKADCSSLRVCGSDFLAAFTSLFCIIRPMAAYFRPCRALPFLPGVCHGF